MQQRLWMRCSYHMFIFFICIDSDMMFLDLNFCRNKTILSGYHIRQLFPSVFSKLIRKFLLAQIMIDPSYRQSGKILILFSLFPSGSFFYFQFLWFFHIRITDGFSFIKKYDLSIDLHKADLGCILHMFCGSSKTMMFCQHHLFHKKLHLLVQQKYK